MISKKQHLLCSLSISFCSFLLYSDMSHFKWRYGSVKVLQRTPLFWKNKIIKITSYCSLLGYRKLGKDLIAQQTSLLNHLIFLVDKFQLNFDILEKP